jgi:hypothetical protein
MGETSMALTVADIKRIIEEIEGEAERNRRAQMERRGKIYKDGGKEFLIDQITSEFGAAALNEMRLAPINILKAIVDKKAITYKRPPIRKTEVPRDQALIDTYVKRMCFDSVMQKADRYYELYANTQLYVVPSTMFGFREPVVRVVPPNLYSVKPQSVDQTKMEVLVYSRFTKKDQGVERKQERSTGAVSASPGYKTTGDQIESNENVIAEETAYIFWTRDQHFTVLNNGAILTDILNPEALNPFGVIPSVNLAKDRDNEFWAIQGEDTVDLAIAAQLGYSDLLSIAKMQGFSLLTVISEEQPKRLEIGTNKIVWLKQRQDGPQPSISYVQATSPISEYQALLDNLMELTLGTNGLSPGSISGKAQAINSGFQALIMNADNLQQLEQKKPVFRDAERETWKIIAVQHNALHDSNELSNDLRALGKFSDGFDPQTTYPDIRPLESDQDRLTMVEKLLALGLETRAGAVKKLNPDMSDDEVDEKLKAIDDEKQARIDAFDKTEPRPGGSTPPDDDDGDEEPQA